MAGRGRGWRNQPGRLSGGEEGGERKEELSLIKFKTLRPTELGA